MKGNWEAHVWSQVPKSLKGWRTCFIAGRTNRAGRHAEGASARSLDSPQRSKVTTWISVEGVLVLAGLQSSLGLLVKRRLCDARNSAGATRPTSRKLRPAQKVYLGRAPAPSPPRGLFAHEGPRLQKSRHRTCEGAGPRVPSATPSGTGYFYADGKEILW